MFFRRPDSHLYAPQRLFLPAHPVSRPRTLGGGRNAPVRTLSGRTGAAGHPARPCGQSRRHPCVPHLATARHPLRHHRAQQHLRARLNQAVAARSHAGGGGRCGGTVCRQPRFLPPAGFGIRRLGMAVSAQYTGRIVLRTFARKGFSDGLKRLYLLLGGTFEPQQRLRCFAGRLRPRAGKTAGFAVENRRRRRGRGGFETSGRPSENRCGGGFPRRVG